MFNSAVKFSMCVTEFVKYTFRIIICRTSISPPRLTSYIIKTENSGSLISAVGRGFVSVTLDQRLGQSPSSHVDNWEYDSGKKDSLFRRRCITMPGRRLIRASSTCLPCAPAPVWGGVCRKLWSGSGTNKSVPVAACRECYAGEEVATIAKRSAV